MKTRNELINWKFLLASLLAVAVMAHSVYAVGIGISPGRVKFENVLKEGYSERTVLISTSGEEEIEAVIRVDGSIRDWISFEPNVSSFTFSKDRPYSLKIIAKPPADIQTGNYSGSIEFITQSISGVSGRAGSIVKTAVTMMINLEVTGTQVLKCRAGAFTFKDAEVGFPFDLAYTVMNDGNVRISPVITIDIWDQLQENLLFTTQIVGDEILPTTQGKIMRTLANTLKEGQYWANMKVDECRASDLLTFTVVEKGGILDKGELIEILNKPWSYTNETVQITAKFQNQGQRAVNAKFKGTIRLDDRIVKLVETDEIIVPAGEITDFDIFFAPETPGRYTLAGRVNYNKKITFEKGTVINVIASSDYLQTIKFRYLPLLLYLIMIITILFIIRKILKERKKKERNRV